MTNSTQNEPQKELGEERKYEEGNKEDTKTGDEVDLPQSKTFRLNLEGMTEQREASLVSGDGYSFYMFDFFSFDRATNKLSMNIDANFYVEITKFSSDYDLVSLRNQAEEELSQHGEVTELIGEEINIMIRDADLFLLSSAHGITKQIMIKEVDGIGYKFTMNMPHTEPMEGFGPHALTSIQSIVNH